MNKKVKYLIADTTAFIKNAHLQDYGEEIFTSDGVLNEIKNNRQLKRLAVLPYDLKVKDVFAENIAFITEFAKKTGDYRSLSAIDIQVMALTLQMEKQINGDAHLNKKPRVAQVNLVGIQRKIEENVANDLEQLELNENREKDDEWTTIKTKKHKKKFLKSKSEEAKDQKENIIFKQDSSEVEEKEIKNDDSMNNEKSIENEITNELKTDDGDDSEEDVEDDDDWITSENIDMIKKREMFGRLDDVSIDVNVQVACLTTDFSMQNVLKQIGLNVVSLDGVLIKHLRTYILRCYACFKTTSILTKKFCPKCGYNTLKKVAVSLDADGNQVIHINIRRPLTSRGKRYSIRTPQGGKHSNNPILSEDQPVPDQRLSKLAQKKNNPLDPDYIAGYSPFVTRDIYSKSAMLGVRFNNNRLMYSSKKQYI